MRLVNCPKCGCRCSDQNNFCPECGFELNSFFTASKSKSSSTKIIIGIVIGICLLCLVTIFIVVGIRMFKRIPSTIETGPNTTEDANETDSESVFDHVLQSDDEKTEAVDADTPIAGVYSGDDHEILVLDDDGLAYYYCTQIEFTDLQCPWWIKDNKVYIELARLHCTVYSNTDGTDLLFKSDSVNWNPEVFTRLNVEPDEYLTKALSTYDPYAKLNIDGTITYSLDGITYTIPKTFMDYEDEFDYDPDSSGFVEIDAQTDYAATLLFHRKAEDELTQEEIKPNVFIFSTGFYNDVTVGDCQETSVAGHPGYICKVTGYLNEGYSALKDYAVEGYVIVFHNEQTSYTNYISYMRSSNRTLDSSEEFFKMIEAAR